MCGASAFGDKKQSIITPFGDGKYPQVQPYIPDMSTSRSEASNGNVVG